MPYDVTPESTTAIGGRCFGIDVHSGVWGSIPRVVSRHIPPAISRDQAYYWSAVWQQGEQAALEDLAAGRFRAFADPNDAVRWLLSDEE